MLNSFSRSSRWSRSRQQSRISPARRRLLRHRLLRRLHLSSRPLRHLLLRHLLLRHLQPSSLLLKRLLRGRPLVSSRPPRHRPRKLHRPRRSLPVRSLRRRHPQFRNSLLLSSCPNREALSCKTKRGGCRISQMRHPRINTENPAEWPDFCVFCRVWTIV